MYLDAFGTHGKVILLLVLALSGCGLGIAANVWLSDWADGALAASRRVETPSRHRRDSCPSDEVVGGFFFEFEAIRTTSSDRDAPRRSSTSPCQRGGRRP